MSTLTERLADECEYDPQGDSPIDNLIAYKDALEDIVDRIDEYMRSNAGVTDHRMSAADVTGALFHMGFGPPAILNPEKGTP